MILPYGGKTEGRGKPWDSQGGDGESRQAPAISSISEVTFCY